METLSRNRKRSLKLPANRQLGLVHVAGRGGQVAHSWNRFARKAQEVWSGTLLRIDLQKTGGRRVTIQWLNCYRKASLHRHLPQARWPESKSATVETHNYPLRHQSH
jgi:hypothetical protein